jgi:DNA-binding response OmpR family regulator
MTSEVAIQTSSAALPTVWIVDDSPLEAELVKRALVPVYRVEVFTDGASVIEQFASQPPPDAVVLDWRMPGISGIDVCHFLRGRPQTQSLPILMLTVQNGTPDLVQCLAAGADDFLAKPCNAAELSARVSALVRTKRMHERVLSAERAVRSLLMQLPEGVMSVNAGGEITFVNLEAARMLGTVAESLIGKKLQHVLPGIEADKLLPATEDPIPLADVTIDGRVYAPAVRRYAGVDATETTLSLREVTSERRGAQERSRMLAAERAARAHAEEASRAKDDFLAVVSHELRTPLNSILGWTRLLRAGYLDEDKRGRALDTIERSAEVQQKLIEDILDVSRIISGKMSLESSMVNLASAVKSSIDAVRPAAEAKAIDLKLEGADPAPMVVGDPPLSRSLACGSIRSISHGVRST